VQLKLLCNTPAALFNGNISVADCMPLVAIVHYVTLQLSVRDVTGVCAHMCTLENVNCWFYNEVTINMF